MISLEFDQNFFEQLGPDDLGLHQVEIVDEFPLGNELPLGGLVGFALACELELEDAAFFEVAGVVFQEVLQLLGYGAGGGVGLVPYLEAYPAAEEFLLDFDLVVGVVGSRGVYKFNPT